MSCSLHIDLLSVHDIQSFLQRTDSLALQVVDITSWLSLLVLCFFNSRRPHFEFAGEGLLAILYGDGVASFWVSRDVDVEAHDGACVDGFLVDDLV